MTVKDITDLMWTATGCGVCLIIVWSFYRAD